MKGAAIFRHTQIIFMLWLCNIGHLRLHMGIHRHKKKIKRDRILNWFLCSLWLFDKIQLEIKELVELLFKY